MSSITDRLKATKLKKGLDSCKFHNLCFCEYLMPMYNRLNCTSILHSIISISVKSHTASTLTKQQLQQLFSHMKCYFQRSRHLDTVCNIHATLTIHGHFFFYFIRLLFSGVRLIHLDVGESRLIWLKAIWKLKSTTLSAWITSARSSKCIRNDSSIWNPFLRARFMNTYAQCSYYE